MLNSQFNKTKHYFCDMKKYVFFLLLCFSLFLQNCETEFNITSDWKEITIAYGILNHNDSDHFIRIQKAFLDENTSALKIAAIADSLYHEGDLFVEFEIYNKNGIQVDGDTLQVVEGSDFGIEKYTDENTLFGTDPFLLYHSDLEISAGNTCRLKITTPAGNVLTSSVQLLDDFMIWTPRINSEYNLSNREPRTSWNTPEDAAVYGLALKIFYSEDINGAVSHKELLWNIANILPITTTNNNRNLEHIFGIEGDNPISQVSEYRNDFFDFLASNIEVNGLATRTIDSLQFIYTFGSQSMFDYNQVIAAQQQSIAGGGQGIKPYTNIDNGLGLFASRTSKTLYRLTFDDGTKDSLFCSPKTRELNFEAVTPQVRCK